MSADELFLASNSFLLIAAWALSRALLPEASARERALAVLAGLPLLALPVLTLLGSLGWLRAQPALAAIAGLAGALAGWAESRPRIAAAPGNTASAKPFARAALGAALGVVALEAWPVLAGQVLHGSPLSPDDYAYHAPMAADWIQAERLVLAPSNYHAYYPGNAELWAAWFMLPSRLESFTSLAGLHWLALCAVAITCLAQPGSARPASALFGVALLLAGVPFASDASTFAAVDLAGTSAGAAAIAFVSLAGGGAPQEARARAECRLFYAGALSGIAAGCKVTFAPLGLLCLAWALGQQRPSVGQACRSALIFGGAACALGGYWYLRNLLVAGNPVFPAQLGWFEGPFDATARERTSLAFQLQGLEADRLWAAIAQLLSWPEAVAYLLLAGYALTLVALLLPRRVWTDPVRARLLLCLLAGVLALLVMAYGPFSGTHNSQYGRLRVRLRFLLPFALFGIALAGYWVGRLGRLGPAVALATALIAARGLGLGWPALALAAIAGALLGWLPAVEFASRQAGRAPLLAALALSAAVPYAASRAIAVKLPADRQIHQYLSREWRVLDLLPRGTRIVWFASFANPSGYRSYGWGLSRVPVAVLADGSPFRHLHEDWRTYQRRWWRPKRRPKHMAALAENLIAQNIDFALLLRRGKRDWPAQYASLDQSNLAELVMDDGYFALFKLKRR